MRKIGYVSAFLFLSLLLVTGNSFAQSLDTFTVSQLIGTELNTQEDYYVGQISDVVFDPQGQIAGVILSDARGMESKRVAIPYSAISKIGDHTFVYNTPENVYYFYSDAFPSLGLGAYSKEPIYEGERFSQLIGVTVQTPEGEKAARIDDIVIDSENGRVVYCVLSDVRGVEDKIIAVPFNTLSKRGENLFVVNATKEKLVAAPVFRSDDMNKRSYASEVHKYYGLQPYWEGE